MIDKEHVLNRWAAGAGAGTLAKELGCSRGGIRRVVLTAQKAGDPRATRHDHLAGNNSAYYATITAGNAATSQNSGEK